MWLCCFILQHALIENVPNYGVYIEVEFPHTHDFRRKEKADLICRIHKHKGAGGAIPSKLTDGTAGFFRINQSSDTQAIAIAQFAAAEVILLLGVQLGFCHLGDCFGF